MASRIGWMGCGMVLCLVACSPDTNASEDIASGSDAPQMCEEGKFDDLIGQPEAAADIVPDPKRVLPPNSAATLDFRPERTNVGVDENGVIVRIWCG